MYLQTNKGDRKMSSATNTLSIHTKNKKINLSKSLMIKGLQCTKALWLKKYKKEVFTPPDAQILSVFETSNKVGEKACELFPNGKEVPYHNTSFEEKIALTQKWMDEGVENIYEATFQYNGILVMVDILHKTKDGWEIHEVKSSTWHSSKSVEDIGLYVYDAAIQYYVLTGCGLNITKTSIVLINSEYVRGETLDVEKLFSIVPVDEEVAIFQEDIPLHLHSFKSVLEDTDNEPDVDIGRHCKNPYWCAAMEYCWKVQKKIPDYSVFDIFAMTKNSKAMQLYHEGILKVEDIPDDFKLTDNQALTVNAWKTQKESIDKNEIQVFLDSIKYPIYHFDFETFQEAIPTIAGTKPYEQLPFQYSLHIEHKDGTLVHKEFLAKHIGGRYQESMPEDVKKRLGEITQDVSKVVYEAPKPITVDAKLPAIKNNIYTPINYIYTIKIDINGQKITMTQERSIKKEGDNFVFTDNSKSMMGESSDVVYLNEDLQFVKRMIQQAGQNIVLTKEGDELEVNMMGKSIVHKAKGTYLSEGSGFDMVIAGLPLKENYTMSYQTFDIMTQKMKTKSLKVVRKEDGNWLVEITEAGGGNAVQKLWIDSVKKLAVKTESVIPEMGNAKVTTTLEK